MVYTIGYQDKDINFFVNALKTHGVGVLLDVRTRPTGWNPAFRGKALENRTKREGIMYQWRGLWLGGFGAIKESSIQKLADYVNGTEKNICLMCMEADPFQCHRHYEIAERLKRYGVQVAHIVRDADQTRLIDS